VLLSKGRTPCRELPLCAGSGEGCQWQALPSPVQCEETATRTQDLPVTGGKTLPLAPGPPFKKVLLSIAQKLYLLWSHRTSRYDHTFGFISKPNFASNLQVRKIVNVYALPSKSKVEQLLPPQCMPRLTCLESLPHRICNISRSFIVLYPTEDQFVSQIAMGIFLDPSKLRMPWFYRFLVNMRWRKTVR
jgi:hypothetical protein